MPFLMIQSNNRTVGSDSNFTVVADFQLRQYTHIRLKQAAFFNQLYNVTDGTTESPRNNLLDLVVDGTSYTLEIPMGYYNWDDLATALQTAASGEGLSLTFSLSSLTNRITISGATTDLTVLPLPANRGLNLMLGFSRTVPIVGTTSVTAPRTLNLARYLILYIFADVLNARSYATAINNVASIAGCIPVNSAYGEMVVYDDKSTFPIKFPQTLSQVNVRITDDLGYPVSFNGQQISLVFDIT